MLEVTIVKTMALVFLLGLGVVLWVLIISEIIEYYKRNS